MILNRKQRILLAVPFILVLIPTVLSKNDDTLKEGASGREVTEAVLRKLEASKIFTKDHKFLTRLAYIESRFGTANQTFRDEYYGGIWQVEESVFRITQSNNSSLTELHHAIQARFGVDWLQLKWDDLLVPLYSGLAAALYFHQVPEPIPFKISQQADHWQKWYRPLGEVNKFISESEELTNVTRCKAKMQLTIVLDSSGSIGVTNYTIAKDFVAQLTQSFALSSSWIGMLVYSTTYQEIFPIRETIQEMATQIRNAPYLNRGTRTDLGIQAAVRTFQEASTWVGVPRIVLVLTDGNSDSGSDLQGAVKSMEDNHLKSVAVGIGAVPEGNELELIAQHDNYSVFRVAEFEALPDFLFELTSLACETPLTPGLDEGVVDFINKDEKRLFQFQLPSEGITVKVDHLLGNTYGYWSYTERVPSSAIHDGVIDGPILFIPSSISKEAGKSASVFITIIGIADNTEYIITTERGLSDGVPTKIEESTTWVYPVSSTVQETGTTPEGITSPVPTETTTEGVGDLYRCTRTRLWFLCLIA